MKSLLLILCTLAISIIAIVERDYEGIAEIPSTVTMFLVEEKTVTETVTAYIYGYPSAYFTPTTNPSAAPTAEPSATPTENPSTTPTANPSTTPISDTGNWKQQMLNKLNEIRAQKGKPALSLDSTMNSLAEAHSKYQDSISQMTHYDPSGSLGQRCSRLGLKWSKVAENVAMGYTNVPDVMNGWKNSPGHYRNMIGDYRIVGFGRSGNYWTQNFAKN